MPDVLVSTKRISRKRIPVRIIASAAVLAAVAVIAFTVFLRQRPITLRGAVVRQSDDPNKEVPVAGVQVLALDDSTEGTTRSGASLLFAPKCPCPVGQISGLCLRVSCPREGRYAIVTGVGRGMRWARGCSRTSGTDATGEIVWS